MRNSLVVVSLLFASACIAPENAYDPDTDPERQARARVEGRVVLVDPNLDAGALASEAGGLVISLVDGGGKELARAAGADLDVEGGAARFTLNDVVPGVYTLIIGELHARFLGALPGRIDLLPGTDVDVGDMRFIAPAIPEGQGTGVVEGEVEVGVGATGPRSVELFRLTDAGPRSVRSATADVNGGFRFEALSPGTYAVVAGADGYAPAYAMDLAIGDQPGASAELSLAGADALVLLPVSAVLSFPDDVRLVEGRRYTNASQVTAEVLAFGGENVVTGMRLATNSGLFADEGEPLPFESFSATKTLALPDAEGEIVLYAQFEARSEAGFVFISPIFEATLVRDVTPPDVLSAVISGGHLAEDGSYYLTADAVAPALELDASDAVSAVAGIAVVESAVAPSFDEDAFVELFAPAGLAYLTQPLALSGGEGEKHLFVALRDRAGNRSDAFELVVVVDTEPPVIDSVQIAGGADFLLSAEASVVVTSTSADVAHVALARGGSEPTSFVPYDGAALAFTLEPGGGSRSVVARLRDLAGNESGDVSDSVVVDSGAAVLAPSLADSRDIPVSVVARAAVESRLALGTAADDGLTLLAAESYAAAPPSVLSAGADGEFRVFAQVRDGAGVESGLLVADVVVDTTAPAFGSGGVEVDQGAAATRFVSVTVTVDVEDPDDVEDMAVATDGVVDSESFQPYSPTLTALLPPGDCEGDGDPLTLDQCKSVCVVLRDGAGNVSSSRCDAIRLDTTPPTTPAITPLIASVRAETVEIRVIEPATDFDSEPVAGYEITSPAGDFFEVEGEGPFRFRLRPNRENELCVRGKDAAGNVGIEDCAVIDEKTLSSVIANGIDSQGSDIFGDFLAFVGRGGVWLHDLRREPPLSYDDPDLLFLGQGPSGGTFASSDGPFLRMAGDSRTLVILSGPGHDESNGAINVHVRALDERDLVAGGGIESSLDAQIEGLSFDTDGRYIAYQGKGGIYVHDLGPNANAIDLTAPIDPTIATTTEMRVSSAGAATCAGTAPRVARGVVVWCEVVTGVPRVMRSRITNLGDPNTGSDDVRELEQVSGTDPVAPTLTSVFDEAGVMQPVVSERLIAWVEARASGHTLVFLQGGPGGPLATSTKQELAQPFAAANCPPVSIDRIADFSGARLAFLTVNDTSLGLTDVALFDLDRPEVKAACITKDLAPQELVSIDGGRLIFRDTANNESIVLADISRTRWLSATPELAFEAVTSGRDGAVAWIETRPQVCAVDDDCQVAQGERCRDGACTGDRRFVTLLARDLTFTDPGPEVVLDQSVAFFGPSEADPYYRTGGERIAWLRNTGFFGPPPFTLLVAPVSDPSAAVVVSTDTGGALDLDPEGGRLAYVEHTGTQEQHGLGVLKLATLGAAGVTDTVTVDAVAHEVPFVSLERLQNANEDPVVVWQRGGDINDRNDGGTLYLSVAGSPGVAVPIADRSGSILVTGGGVRGPKVARVGSDLWVAYLLLPDGPGSLQPHACRLRLSPTVACLDDEPLAINASSVRDISISRDGLVAFTSDEEDLDEIVLFDVRARRRLWATPVEHAAGDRGAPDIAAGHLVWTDASLGTPSVFEMVLRP